VIRRLDDESSITCLMRRLAAEVPHRAAVTVSGETRDAPESRFSFEQLDAEARRIAAWLAERFRPGDRILLLYPTSVHFASAFLGCLYAGMAAVPAPMPGHYRHHRRRVSAIARDADVSAVLTVAAELNDVVSWAEGEGLKGPGDQSWLPVVASDTGAPGDPGAWSMPATDRSTLALLQYTSGSTGSPKGVMVSHGNLLHNVQSLSDAYRLTEPIPLGGWIPMFHDMGLIGHLFLGLFLGGGVVLITPSAFLRRPYRWLELISDYGLVMSAAPNFGYERCLRHITDEQLEKVDLSSWRYASNGSEPVRASVVKAFTERFASAGLAPTACFPGYGLAENTLFVSGTPFREPVVRRVDAASLEQHRMTPARPGAPYRDLVALGRPADGTQVRVVDPESHQELPDGHVGEIWLRCPSVGGGYWRNEAATDAVFRARTATGDGPFLRTGDLGSRVAEELFVTGRLKDMLIVNGRNLYPHDIEQEIRDQHQELAGGNGAVFSVGGLDGGQEEIVIAHEIRGRRDTDALRALTVAIRATVTREFGFHAAGVVLVRPGGIPLTTSGKVQRTALRQQFLAGEVTALHENLAPRIATLRTATAPAGTEGGTTS
jgi:acyl-CoA synthetase (AMP-forming)/AMP-acid ligase II